MSRLIAGLAAGALIIGLLLAPSSGAAPVVAGQPQAKLDPFLRLLLTRNEQSLHNTGQPLNLARYADFIGVYADGQAPAAGRQIAAEVRPDRIGVLISTNGHVDNLAETGAQIGTVAGNIATARVTLGQLADIVSLPNVVHVAASYRLKPVEVAAPPRLGAVLRQPSLDLSVPETGADALHAAGIDGSGVIVGIVDTGVDWKHLDFRAGGAGEPQSRILNIWDQTDTIGPAPTGFTYGSEWTKAQIEADLAVPAACPPTCVVRERDEDGHGTHVTSIAAGDGSSSAAGFVGMAPAADIIHVKTTLFEADVIDGVTYILQKASALGKPAVVNLSLGGHFGAHDGTGSFEEALDALVGAPGQVIVAAAGNEGDTAIHAGGDMSPLGDADCDEAVSIVDALLIAQAVVGLIADVSCPGNADADGDGSVAIVDALLIAQAIVGIIDPLPYFIDITFDLAADPAAQQAGSDVFDYWYDGASDLCLTIVSPNGERVGPACPGDIVDWTTDSDAVTDDGCLVIINAPAGPDPANGDKELMTWVDGPFWGCVNDAAAGTWTYRFTTAAGSPAARVDGWATLGLNEFNPPWGDTDMTVGIPATGDHIIAAGSYVTKDCWDSTDGNNYCYDPKPTVGDLSPFSSLGPTRDGRTKPEIAAPGQGIAAALSDDVSQPYPPPLVMPDGLHVLIQGTSQASPHVTGAVALLLQQDPSPTWSDIKTALQDNAEEDTFTDGTPNNSWGAGKLRAVQLGP